MVSVLICTSLKQIQNILHLLREYVMELEPYYKDSCTNQKSRQFTITYVDALSRVKSDTLLGIIMTTALLFPVPS